jgi:hypothetical protein
MVFEAFYFLIAFVYPPYGQILIHKEKLCAICYRSRF